MLALLLTWICIAWLSMAFGLKGLHLVSAILKEPKKTDPAAFEPDYTVLFGFILITALLSVISLFLPVNGVTAVFFLLTGAVFSFEYRHEFVRMKARALGAWAAFSVPLKTALIVLFLLTAFSAVFMDIGESDTWFYHSQSILWIKEYAVVPGLGNLFGRLAFNSHFFVASALFSNFLSEDRVIFPLLGFFYFLFNARLLINIHKGIQTKNWFFFTLNCCLFLFFAYQTYTEVNGTDTDVMTCVLLLYAFLLFLESAFLPRNTHRIFLLWVTMFTAATFKHSAIITLLLLLFVVPQLLEKRKVLLFGASAAIIFLPFLIRNVILSGYLIYPLPGTDIIPVDWKIPVQEVVFEKDLIEGWAKLPRGMEDGMGFEDVPKILELPFGEWFQVWWPNQSLRWRLIMLINLCSVFLCFYSLYRKDYKISALCLVLMVNLTFWFFKAPEPRFGFAYLFFGAALVLSVVAAPFVRRLKPAPVVFFIPVLLLLALPLAKKVEPTRWDVSALWYPLYTAKIKTEDFRAGNFTLHVPSKEYPADTYWCFCSKLPCTPFPKDNLLMRGDNYQQGFRCGDKETNHTTGTSPKSRLTNYE